MKMVNRDFLTHTSTPPKKSMLLILPSSLSTSYLLNSLLVTSWSELHEHGHFSALEGLTKGPLANTRRDNGSRLGLPDLGSRTRISSAT
jgi:hypothetical protein